MPKPVPQTVNQQASDLLQPGLGSTSVNDKDQQGSATYEMDTLLIHICIVFSIFLQPNCTSSGNVSGNTKHWVCLEIFPMTLAILAEEIYLFLYRTSKIIDV